MAKLDLLNPESINFLTKNPTCWVRQHKDGKQEIEDLIFYKDGQGVYLIIEDGKFPNPIYISSMELDTESELVYLRESDIQDNASSDAYIFLISDYDYSNLLDTSQEEICTA